eukprot:12534606-Ditylum_brightwellii.AAC.2
MGNTLGGGMGQGYQGASILCPQVPTESICRSHHEPTGQVAVPAADSAGCGQAHGPYSGGPPDQILPGPVWGDRPGSSSGSATAVRPQCQA